MSTTFSFDDGNDFKERFKKFVPVIGMVIAAIVILGILIIPGRLENSKICDELGLGGQGVQSETCKNRFNQIIFVVGDTANTPKPAVTREQYIKLAYDKGTLNSGIYAISVAEPSATPVLVGDEMAMVDEVSSKISKMKAKTDGADYFEAIRNAASHIVNGGNNRGLIYVIGSGLSDRGILNFAENEYLIGEKNVSDIVNKIYAEIMDDDFDFDGVTVLWDGVGKTVSPQQALDKSAEDRVYNIYSRLLKKLGLDSKIIREDRLPQTENDVEYTVKTTKVENKSFYYLKEYVDTGAFQFEADSDVFVDKEASEKEAREIADILLTYPDEKIYITAYMSKGARACSSLSVNVDLLISRLKAVKDIIQDMSGEKIQEERFVMEEGGFGPEEECPNGTRDEEASRKNRKVVIRIE